MRRKSETPKTTFEQIVKNIRRATRKYHSAEEKIRIVLDGLRGDYSMPSCAGAKALLRACTTWLKEFLEAGKRRLAGDTAKNWDQRRGDHSPARGVRE